MVRRRSIVWGFFSTVDSETVQCLLCRCSVAKRSQGTTTAMLKHLRVKHPAEAIRKIKGRVPEGTFIHGHQDMETDGEQYCSVEVALEDGDCDNLTMGNNSTTIILEAEQSEQMANEEAVTDFIVTRKRGKRSVIWRHFESLESLSAARCRICMKKLQCCEGGSTSNLHRHMSKRHPEVFAQLFSDGQNPRLSQSSQRAIAVEETSTPQKTGGGTEKRGFPDISMEDEDSDNHNTAVEADINPAITEILDSAQGGPAQQMTDLEVSGDHPSDRRRSKRSVIWKHFERLESLDAAQCRLCMKKIQCFEGGSTSNLHRHMSKRHPEVFSRLWTDGQSQSVNGDTAAPSGTVRATKKRQNSGALKFSRASEGEMRVFRRERELIEALRRAQKEEAQALQQQRELIEKLRAANARETAAEREQIESLRKAQMEEAEDLRRQREELQKEKEEMQKKWQELQQQS
ncbi:zinc finger BED domain-containing protein [Cheilinus undulatus]|uniref:zinc finger BED domain-containing protein n=1 Tax=Cheilinus undulatus TaxID=241271 RepID=UPI001BD3A305|nr:zinc finger BED domain-containing protein [Cheilinus undulatus]